MNLLKRIGLTVKAFRATSGTGFHPRDPVLAAWFGGANTLAGATVTPENAKKIVAVMACVRLLAEVTASLPLILYRKAPGGDRERAESEPLYERLRWQPNKFQTAFEFWEMMVGHLLLRGNAYAEIIGTQGRAVDELLPLHPDRVIPFKTADGNVAYKVWGNLGVVRILLADEVFHLKDSSSDGLQGESRILLHAETIGLAAAQDEKASRSVGQGASLKGVLSTDKTLSDKARMNLEKSWNAKYEGPDNAGKTAVLEEGLAWKAIGISPADAELLSSRKFSVVDIARIYRVPPHLVGELEDTNRSTSEQTGQEFSTYSLGSWLVRIEQAVRRDLITSPELFAEFLRESLLRGDFITRMRGYAIGRQWGFLSANDIRKRENMNGIGDQGDVYITPLNMGDAADLGNAEVMDAINSLRNKANGNFTELMLEAVEEASRKTEGSQK